jgi:hypothetical protein
MKTFMLLCLSLPVLIGFQPTLPVFKDTAECVMYDHLMGQTDNEIITICPDNIKEAGFTEQMVIKHEMVHVIHYNFGWMNDETLIPEPYFTDLVREHVPSEEVLLVITSDNYDDYTNQELEARLLSKLPTPVIMTMYWVSQEHATFNLGDI